MFNILCFGDSNTHGYNSETDSRFDLSTRWTGRLARALGEDFQIMEAGTNGMTIAFGEGEEGRPYNGMKCLPVFLNASRPLDGVVIMLGTNDTKAAFASSAEAITENMRRMIASVRENPLLAGTPVKIFLIAPVPLQIQDPPIYDMDETSGEISRRLGGCYRKLAEEEGVYFADAGKWGVELNPDGCHLSRIGHYTFACRMEALLREVFCRG
jgi:lysophospholipase L1-like esterase